MFAIAGNVTYVLSICVVSMEKKYLIANASWLAGDFPQLCRVYGD